MNELLSKSFWDGVKKTFDQALKGPAPDDALQTTAKGDASASSPSEIPPAPSDSSERN
jgi:hypothetical protein